MVQDNNLENLYVTHLSALSIFDHLKSLLKNYLIEFVVTITTVFLSLWGIFGAFSFFGIQFSIFFPYGVLIIASLLISFSRIGYHYYITVPSGFKTESRKIQKLAHFKRPKWEFKLTRDLLTSNLSPIDKEIDELLDGQHFVSLKKAPNEAEYTKWVQLRLDNIQQMVHVATKLLIFRLPNALKISKGELASEIEILNSIKTIKKLYKQTYKFEAELYEIKPPDGFEKLHELQVNWSDMVRDSVNQYYDFLENVIQANFDNGDVEIKFMIKVKQPPKINEFIEEMGRMSSF